MDRKIIIKNLSLKWTSTRLDTENWVLQCANIDIQPGTIYSLLGENMSGKSTFLEFILGNQQIEILDMEDPCIQRSRPELPNGKRIHHADEMFPSFSLVENAIVPNVPWSFRKERETRRKFFRYLADHIAFKNVNIHTKLRDLSSGGAALVKLFRASVSPPSILLIDEVTANLDARNTTLFIETLLDILSPPQSAIIVSHDHSDHLELERRLGSTNFAYQKLVCSLEGNYSCLRRPE